MQEEQESNEMKIAIIGMSGSFPGAENTDALWDLIKEGKEGFCFLGEKELARSGINPEKSYQNSFVPVTANMPNLDCFDANFFGYSPKEAQWMDPQHRKFLEHSWAALEDAGYDPNKTEQLISIYAGSSLNTYLLHNLYPNCKNLDCEDLQQAIFGNGQDYITTRSSYHLNLKGPSVAIQTACSTSLSAIHEACQSLLTFQSDMALAGGVSLKFPHNRGYLYQKDGILSPDGHCRVFDEKAQGTVFANGIGVILLKRLDDALEDHDHIYAVILASSMNNDGTDKVGYMAPSVEGQAKVIAQAHASANIPPETISYIEAHGTGTSIGDPIEVAALTKAFKLKTQKKGFCSLGSLKSNIGHLDVAAGVAGIIKVILAMQNREIPPCINFSKANPKMDLTNSPFCIHKKTQKWTTDSPLRAGVSSFGVGGTNVHAILEEAPSIERVEKKQIEPVLLILSAKTADALEKQVRALHQHLLKNSSLSLKDVAYTLQIGRKDFPYRFASLCKTLDDAIIQLSSFTKEALTITQSTKGDVDPSTLKIFDNESLLKELRQCWLQGNKILWKNLYLDKPYRVSLPSYPFDKQQHWIESSKSENSKAIDEKNENIHEWFYAPSWHRSAFPQEQIKGQKLWLIFQDDYEIANHLIDSLKKNQQRCIIVKKGKSFSNRKNHLYTINPTSKKDYFELFQKLREQNLFPSYWAHFWSINREECPFEEIQNQGLYSIILACQAASKKLKDFPCNIGVITNNFANISGIEKTDPSKSTLLGATKVIPKEYASTKSCLIDIQISSHSSDLASFLLHEITSMKDEEIAFRGNMRWIRTYDLLRQNPNPRKRINIKRSHSYLITGGLGHFGLEMGQFLSSIDNVNLLLLSRSPFPCRNDWENYLKNHGMEDPISEKILKIKKIEVLGSKVTIFQCNVADKKALKNLHNHINQHHGYISGIIHAAGTVNSGMIDLKAIDEFKQIFEAKVYGTKNICHLFKKHPLDFVLLCSSMNSIIGGLGQVENTAANAFVDSYAEYSHSQEMHRVFAMNWGAVNESRPRKYTSLPQFSQLSQEHIKNRMFDHEIREVYKRLFSSIFGPRVVISTIHFTRILDTWNRVSTLKELTKDRDLQNTSRNNCLALAKVIYTPPSNEIEKTIIAFWENVLGIQPIGINDDFFSMGGHSLSAIQVLSNVIETYRVKMHVMTMYEYPTAKTFGAYIHKLLKIKNTQNLLQAGGV